MEKFSNKSKCKVGKKQPGVIKSKPKDRTIALPKEGSNEKDINMLDDHILETIFGHLSEMELIEVEQVCQKWKNICNYIWSTRRTLKFLNFLDFDKYEAILSRCGPNLTSLTYFVDMFYICPNCVDDNDQNLKADFFLEYNNRIIPPIVEYCKNLTDLELTGLNKVQKPVLKSLAHCSFFRNVTSLVLSDLQLNDDILEIILKKATKLHTLSINTDALLGGFSLMYLTEGIVTLIISGCCCLQENVMRKVFQTRLPNLIQLGACSVKISLRTINNQRKLVELYVHDAELFKDLSYDQIPNLCFPQLRILQLNNNSYVTDYALSCLSDIFPNLEDLDLSECRSSNQELKQEISNFGISQLVKLPKLKILKLNNLKKINFDAIVSSASGTFDKLKELECHTISGGISSPMTSSGVSSIILLCPNLEILDLRGNSYITNDLLQRAFKAVGTGNKNQVARIQVLVANEDDPELMASCPPGDFDSMGRLIRKPPSK